MTEKIQEHVQAIRKAAMHNKDIDVPKMRTIENNLSSLVKIIQELLKQCDSPLCELKVGNEGVENLITEELIKSNTHFPPFHSYHEGFAVLMEEHEEVEEEIEELEASVKLMWKAVKNDQPEYINKNIIQSYQKVINAIEELIQVGAMLQKFQSFLKQDLKQDPLLTLKNENP